MLVLPNKTSVVWEKFLEDNKSLVYKYIVRTIKKEMSQNRDRIDLFKFEDGSMHAWIPSNHILKFLDDAMKLFIEKEEYEYAEKVNRLIKQYHIDKLIRESSKEEG